MNPTSILLFDGVCNLCSQSVQFVIRRDPSGQFQFASLQSDVGQRLLRQYDLPNDLNTVVLIENGKAYTRSDVPLRVAPRLSGFWAWVRIGYLLPKALRDRIYDWVAANRYRWFGQQDACWLPDKKWAGRFLERA
ncbi:MAG: thiol-disulfide oxidoreductase DCC family protein [Bacteroidota bacterium]